MQRVDLRNSCPPSQCLGDPTVEVVSLLGVGEILPLKDLEFSVLLHEVRMPTPS